jgi:hypothetical protein
MYAALMPFVNVDVAPETVSELLMLRFVVVAKLLRRVPSVVDAEFRF